ncbi:jg166 [Pararge aegeria aegeria]|uniref:Jg166 protein n=1 Tax=Pararge aegeria aegeria TaxID=348720 RepID=A0A8S4QQF9_9NEOP|nr:jg166 [Pararge aegeria aegeria]
MKMESLVRATSGPGARSGDTARIYECTGVARGTYPARPNVPCALYRQRCTMRDAGPMPPPCRAAGRKCGAQPYTCPLCSVDPARATFK